MEHTDEMFCSFCKKSASNLVTHSLCDCCLVHSSCCDATAENSVPIISRPAIEMAATAWEEDAGRKVECDICLEEYQENELQQHREMCMPRLVFRCSLCNEDYLREESLWNHLIVHQIAYENKELYYQQKRVTYKQHECILCNDQRSYQESAYWEHVHEDHDGFYLRCSECGENFRSQKRKADHGLNYCKDRERIVTFESGGLEILSEETFEVNQGDQQSSPKSKVVESSERSTFVKDCDDDLTDDDADKGETEKESKVPSDLKCPHCNKEWPCAKTLARHIECSHEPATCDICGLFFSSGGRARYHKVRHHSEKKFQCSKCLKEFFSKYNYRRHLASHQDKNNSCEICNLKCRTKYSLEKHMKGFHRFPSEQCKPKTDCPICRENFSNQSQVSQHVEKIHNVTICIICREICANADELHECSTCPHCGKGCKDRTQLITHIELRHDEATCDVCEVTFYGKRKLLYHKLKVHSAPQFKCSQCSKTFNLKFEYTRHMSFCVKKGSMFPCQLCDQKFDSFDSITTHLKIVHDVMRPQEDLDNDKKSDGNLDMGQEEENTIEMKSIVDVNESSLLESEDLMPHDQSERSFAIEGDDDDTNKDVASKVHEKGVHRRRDKSGNVLPCKFCDRKFRSKVYVRKHIYRMHSERKGQSKTEPNQQLADGGKSLSDPTVDNSSALEMCPHCGKSFKKTYLSRHISENHKNKSSCKICKISFVKKHQQVYHMLICHTDPKHKCPYCPEMFHVKQSYDRHVATHEKHNS